MRIVIDYDLCQGHAVCLGECPEVFDVDEEQNKVRLLQANPSAELRDKVALAVQYCPTRALSIEE